VYDGLKGQSYNTVDDVGYGVPHGRGPNELVFRNDILPKDTDSWAPIWGEDYKGKLSIYDNQIFIADAAVYLKATQPDLGIDNPSSSSCSCPLRSRESVLPPPRLRSRRRRCRSLRTRLRGREPSAASRRSYTRVVPPLREIRSRRDAFAGL
jgi:hypothetical protein